jgi:hypothetical protein
MVANAARGVIVISRRAIGLSVATLSDGSRGMRCQLVTCHAVTVNNAEQRHRIWQ